MKKIYKIKNWTTFVNICLISLLFVSCTITRPRTRDKVASFDSSTPAQYDPQNSGFIGFATNGDGIITPNAREKYNNLIDLYKNSFYLAKAIKLEKDAGITPYSDSSNNLLYLIKPQHITYFMILNNWKKNNRPIDVIGK